VEIDGGAVIVADGEIVGVSVGIAIGILVGDFVRLAIGDAFGELVAVSKMRAQSKYDGTSSGKFVHALSSIQS
jgi:hypothetical protein